MVTVTILTFRTARPGQTVQTQIRRLRSDQGLHCLQFHLYLLEALLYGKASLFKFRVITANISDVRSFRIFTVGTQKDWIFIISLADRH